MPVALLLLVHAAVASPGLDWVRIPGATYTQGSPHEPDAPARNVTLSTFEIMRHEVTIAEYESFVATGPGPAATSGESAAWWAKHPDGAGPEHRAAGRSDTHPVVAITWHEAAAYCGAQGGRLPTEAEWEYAACGAEPRTYPWGDVEAVPARWYAGGKFGTIQAVETAPVDDEDPACASPFGLTHAAGNVWEWTADVYHRDAWTSAAATNPTGPPTGPWRVLRGGSWMNLPSYATCHHREPARPDRVAYTVGIRCARDVKP